MQSQKMKEKKKNLFLCPSPFSKLRFTSQRPVGKTTTFRAMIAQGQIFEFQQKTFQQSELSGEEAEDNCG